MIITLSMLFYLFHQFCELKIYRGKISNFLHIFNYLLLLILGIAAHIVYSKFYYIFYVKNNYY